VSTKPLIELALDGARTAYEPGETLEGTASWDAPGEAPANVELRLFWFTKGSGDQDLVVVDRVGFAAPAAREHRRFKLSLPEGPYSFEGKLVTLVWALELVALPGDEAARTELVIAPGARPVLLPTEDVT
jgi:hypothetical protein